MCMSDLLINQMIHDTKMKHDLIHVGECSNKECQYLHIDPESKIKDCPWYDRGFCKHGMSSHVSITVMQFTSKRLKRLKMKGWTYDFSYNINTQVKRWE